MGGSNVFVSGVSSEFGALRDQVASDLRARGLSVKVQQDFRQEADSDTTLEKLHNYIRDCGAVVCIIGVRSGSKPTASEAARFAKMLPDGIIEASYAQWEFHFARYYKRRLSLHVAKNRYKRGSLEKGDDNFPTLQRSFLKYVVNTLGLDRDYFATTNQLCRSVLRQDWPSAGKAGADSDLRFMDGWGLASSFQRVLDERWDHFWGREWLFADIRAAVRSSPASRLFVVSGLPGSGKSAIFTSFIDKEHCGPVLAYHCCQRDKPPTLEPRGFVRNLAFMLAEELPNYRQTLEGMPHDNTLFNSNSEIDPVDLFSGLIIEPLTRVPPPEDERTFWIAIDAVDEAEEAGNSVIGREREGKAVRTIAGVIASEVGHLPPWLRIFATGRPNVVRESLTELFDHEGRKLTWLFEIDDKAYPEDINACIEGKL